jgi:uncharacterized protein (DUF58 family)
VTGAPTHNASAQDRTANLGAGPAPSTDATLYLHPQTLARLKSFELRAKHIVEGVMTGAHRSPYHGFSVEFAEHRPYVPGDDLRHLDWKVFARSDKLHLKQYQQETNLDVMICVDASGSMNFGTRDFAGASGDGGAISPGGNPFWSKFDHATAMAAAMSYVALRQGDRAGLVIYADAIRALLKRSSAQRQWRQIVSALSSHAVDAPSNTGRMVDQLLANLTNRCLVVLISDFFEEPDAIRAALARLKHRRHDVIMFQTLDQQEIDFNLADSAPFEGLEGEGRLKLDPRTVRESYLEAMRRHQETLKRTARSFGFDFAAVSTHQWLGPSLAGFLARRRSRMKRGSS